MKFTLSLETKRSFAALFYTLSGATGLIYQIIWFKYLGLFLGNTTYAQMIVLVSFLGGLAIGNFIFGKYADKFKRPVFVYGALELVIGIYCLLYHWLATSASDIFFSAVQNSDAAPDSVFILSIKFLISASLLIVPTIAMGGTFPTISRFFSDEESHTRKATATLYFLNSFGAVWGILLVGFFLIPTLGLNATLTPTAILNIAIGLLALFIKHEFTNKNEVADSVAASEPEKKYSKKIIIVSIAIAGLSGFAALSYEMLWTRLLINVFGSSTYAFSLMLMAFICGIALGSYFISLQFFSRFNKINLIIVSQILIAAGILFALPIFDRLPYYLWQIGSMLNKSAATFTIFLIIEFLICFALMFIPTIFMGMSLPLIVEVVNTGKDEISNSIGKVFAVNTIGTVLGVILTALLFVPALGVRNTFEIGIMLNIVSAFLLIFAGAEIANIKKYIFTSVAIIFFVFHFAYAENFNADVSISGVFRYFSKEVPKTYEDFLALMRGRRILMFKEGVNANVAVVESGEEKIIRSLIINGKADASTGIDMSTQILCGQIPMMFHKKPENVCVVGVGSGVTLGSILSHDVKSVECLEITKEVIEAARYFNIENNFCLDDKRLKIIIDDALSYLKSSSKKYDVIVSEPSNPWIAGIGNLFTVDFFESCKNKLTDDGMMVQWFHTYESSDELLTIVLNSFGQAFPHAYVFVGSGNDLLILGSKKAIQVDAKELKRRFEQVKVKKNFERGNVKNLFTFLTTQMLSPKSFYSLTNENNLNRELKPVLEFLAPSSLFMKDNAKFVHDFDERFRYNMNNLIISQIDSAENISEAEFYDALLFHFTEGGNGKLVYALATEFLKSNYSYRIDALRKKSADELGLHLIDLNVSGIDSVSSAEVKSFLIDQSLNSKSNAASFLGNISLAKDLEYLENTTMKDTIKHVQILTLAVKLYYLNGEFENAGIAAGKVQNYLNNKPELGLQIDAGTFSQYASLSYLALKQYRKAIEYSMAFVGLSPDESEKSRLTRRLKWEMEE